MKYDMDRIMRHRSKSLKKEQFSPYKFSDDEFGVTTSNIQRVTRSGVPYRRMISHPKIEREFVSDKGIKFTGPSREPVLIVEEKVNIPAEDSLSL